MLEKLKTYFIAHLLSAALIMVGWYMSVIDAALDRFSAKSIFTGTTVAGLILIFVGAYLPEIWIAITSKKKD